jgi:hypothetical protein
MVIIDKIMINISINWFSSLFNIINKFIILKCIKQSLHLIVKLL